TYSLKKQFLLGTDILVIPVLKDKQKTVKGYLPSGQWRHLLTGQLYEGKKEATFKAPLGTPAVFIKEESSWKEGLLNKLKGL
ncbi:MAG: alpha-glucosidase, partial [Bdellovibrionota bacterium]|nr:alpha-glucosidase [Bdellovibrionota bacterium]